METDGPFYSLNQALANTTTTTNVLSAYSTVAACDYPTIWGGIGMLGSYGEITGMPYGTQVANPVQAVKRKAKGVLAQLRHEIDGWHGDVLNRCPA